jgi:2,3-bisphosphoglycerate-independent phosphoglycerate mutase
MGILIKIMPDPNDRSGRIQRSHNLYKLKKHSTFKGINGPLLIAVMDGIGVGPSPDPFNAVFNSHTPGLDLLKSRSLYSELLAHGTHVGLPDDTLMGNSEVGHNALGAGRLMLQGATLVKKQIETGEFAKSEVLNQAIENALKNDSAFHCIGLLQHQRSVHAHLDHLKAIVHAAREKGVKKIFVHGLTDGRDDPEGSALDTIMNVEQFLAERSDSEHTCRIASGGGRMVMTMDRYWADPQMLETGWNTHVRGEGRQFESASKAVQAYYDESDNGSDQYCFPFVIAENGEPIGRINDGDTVIFFNYRGDRSIEISKAFEDEEFTFFNRGKKPDVFFAGLLSYDPDENVPSNYLVKPAGITDTYSELLAGQQVSQLALTETQKYGHVTYFWNGNRAEMFDSKYEEYIEITSDPVPEYAAKPWMKSSEIATKAIELIENGSFKAGRINFANGDMVGHTGSYNSACSAVTSVDLGISRLLPVIEKAGGAMIVTADHGNAEDMVERDKKGNPKIDSKGLPKPRTSHTTNPVPCYVFAPGVKMELAELKNTGTIRNVASTALNLLGFETPEFMDESLIKLI